MRKFEKTLAFSGLAAIISLGATACAEDNDSVPMPKTEMTKAEHEAEIERIEGVLVSARTRQEEAQQQVEKLEFDLAAHLYEIGIRPEMAEPVPPTTLR